MINKKIAKHIVTLGCDYKNPKGGIAQVINLYSGIFERFYFIPTVKDGMKIYKFIVFVQAILKLCYLFLTKDIKIVHIHGCSDTSFRRKKIFIYLSKFFNKKVVYHVHGAEFKVFCAKYGKNRIIRTLNKCDVIVALSRSWKDFFNKELEQPRVVVINNIIPVPRPYPIQKNTGIFNLVFLGLIGERKGIFDLIELLKTHYEEYRNKLVLHIGGNGDVSKLQKIILPVEDIVKYHGWVDEGRKQQLLSLADIYILPSYNEGLPISILEAMSYKLPVISTKVGGIPEIVEDNMNGFLITPGDQCAMKIVLDKLLSDREICKEMGSRSYVIASKHYPQEVEKQLVALYKQLL